MALIESVAVCPVLWNVIGPVDEPDVQVDVHESVITKGGPEIAFGVAHAYSDVNGNAIPAYRIARRTMLTPSSLKPSRRLSRFRTHSHSRLQPGIPYSLV